MNCKQMMEHPWMNLQLDAETSPLLKTKKQLKKFNIVKVPLERQDSDGRDEFGKNRNECYE